MARAAPVVALIAQDGTQLTFDVVREYGVSRSVTVTEHAVESGANISDHARNNPTSFTCIGRVTGAPWDGPGVVGGAQRMAGAIAWLELHARQLVTIVSARFGVMPSMVLTKWPTKADSVERLDFQIEARQVVVATAGMVDIPPEAPATEEAATTLPDEVDVGEQPTTSTDATTSTSAATTSATATTSASETSQTEADTSVALDILTAMGIEP